MTQTEKNLINAVLASVTDEMITNLSKFLIDMKEVNPISYEKIEGIYNDFTMDAMIDKFVNVL